MDNDERRKTKELLKEKEKGDVPLQWMYHESKPDTEDYLLGKRIDKIGDEKEEKKNDTYEALFNERIQHNIAMDVKAKMREDPLFAIRHSEEQAKRKLLDNPVKMKRLQEAIQRQKEAKQKKSKKKKHKKKSDSEDSSDELMTQYLNIWKAKHEGTKPPSDDRVGHSKHKDRETHERYKFNPGKNEHRSKGRDESRNSPNEHRERKRQKYSDSEEHGYRREIERSRKDRDQKYERRGAHYMNDYERGTSNSKRTGEEKGNYEHRSYKSDNRYRQRDSSSDRETYRQDKDRKYRHRHRSDSGSDRESDRKGKDKKHEQIGRHESSRDRDRSRETIDSHSRPRNRHDSSSDSDRNRKYKDKYNRHGSGHRTGTDSYRKDYYKDVSKNSKHSISQGREEKSRAVNRDNKNSNKYMSDSEYSSDSETQNKLKTGTKTKNNSKSYHVSSDSSEIDDKKIKVYSKSEDKYAKLHRENEKMNRKHDTSSSSSDEDDSESISRTKKAVSGRNVSSRIRHDSSSGSSSDEEFSNNKARRKVDNSEGSGAEERKAPKGYGLVILNPKQQKIIHKETSKGSESKTQRSRSPDRRETNAKKRPRSPSPPQAKRKLTAEEKQRRLEEMMDNAKWREDQRRTNVSRYAKEDRREEDDQEKNYEITGSSEFVNPMMSLHAEKSSVEDRIKRNKHNILRTTADMEKGFSKR